MPDLRTRIINFRAKKNLSMEKFAKMCGVTSQTIYNIENNLSTPTRLTVAKIVKVLKEGE